MEPATTSLSTAASQEPRTPGRNETIFAVIGLVVLSFVLVGLHVHGYTALSPIDELQHIDYAYKASHGELVRRGDTDGQAAFREEACLGLDSAYEVVPKCSDTAFDPIRFQEFGKNTAYIHPPVYYAITGGIARAVQAVLPIQRFTVAARLVGALWLAGGLILTWFLLLELGTTVLAAGAGAVILGALPITIFSSATVNPDAALLACGAGLGLLTLRYARRASPAWLLGVVAAAATSIKVQSILAIGAAGLVLLIRWLDGRRSAHPEVDGRRFLIGAAALVIGFGVVAIGWSITTESIARVRADSLSMNNQAKVDHLEWGQVTGSLDAVIPPAKGRQSYLIDDQFGGLAWEQLSGWLLTAAPLLAALAGSLTANRRLFAIGLSTSVSYLVAGSMFVLINYYVASIYALIPPRYGLAVVPLAVAGGVRALDHTAPARRITYVVAAVGTLLVMAAMLLSTYSPVTAHVR